MFAKKKRLLFGALAATAAGLTGLAYAQDNPDALTSTPPPAPMQTQPSSPEQRMAALEQSGEIARATVTFTKRLADNQVSQTFEKAGVRPFAVFMFLEGMAGLHQVDPAKASLDLVGKARTATATMQDKAVKGARKRAKDLSDLPRKPDIEASSAEETSQAVLSSLEQSEKMAASARRGTPTIFAAYVIGSAAQLKALQSSPQVQSVEIGYKAGDRVALPAPVTPADARGTFSPSTENKVTGSALALRLKAVGEGK
jgi:hypothetical protein